MTIISARQRLYVPTGLRPAAAVWAGLLLASLVLHPGASRAGEGHLAVNLRGDFVEAGSVGFDLADVSSIAVLDTLPDGMKGVFWLGNGYNTECSWRLSDQEVTKHVEALKSNPKFSGIYYIADEPHPARCSDAAERVTERSRLIRGIDPEARTFILVQNSSSDRTEFEQFKDAADFIGIAPYPCNIKNSDSGCDYDAIGQRIDEALAAGIPAHRIVPVFQVFGQDCAATTTPYYRLPSVKELERMLAIWDERVPPAERPFDMAYTWGAQERSACPALSQADGSSYPALRETFAKYIAGQRTAR